MVSDKENESFKTHMFLSDTDESAINIVKNSYGLKDFIFLGSYKNSDVPNPVDMSHLNFNIYQYRTIITQAYSIEEALDKVQYIPWGFYATIKDIVEIKKSHNLLQVQL
jgi:hypothetical protein